MLEMLFIYMRVIYIVHTIKVSECVNEEEYKQMN